MEPTTTQPSGAGSGMMQCPPMGDMGSGMGGMGMMGGCPCMQMHQMMSSSPMIGWGIGIAMTLLLVAVISALASLSVFLIRRSRNSAAA